MKEDLLYVAGFLDGEGTITLSKGRSIKKFRYPVVSISSTTLSILEYFKSKFGGHISKHKVYKEHYKQSWSWKLSNDKAILFCSLIYTYLREPDKYRRAKLIVDKYKSVTIRNGKYSDTQKAIKLNFEYRFFHPSNTID